MFPPSKVRSREGGLNTPCDLLKWKFSVLEYLTIRPNFFEKNS